MPVNVPPVGPAPPSPPITTSAAPVNPWLTNPYNIGAYTNSKTHLSQKAFGFGTLSPLPLLTNGSLGAGLTGSAISASIVLPQACKIPKVAVAYKSVDTFTGAETFNIVVEGSGDYNPANPPQNNPLTGTITTNLTGTPFGAGTGLNATYTAGIAQTLPPLDNSGWVGYPTQFAAVGNCLFGTDVPFGPTTFTNPGAGTTGGSQVLPTTAWDAVFAAGTTLSVRAVTTASTGSVTNLSIVLLVQLIDTKPQVTRAVPCYAW